MTVRINTENRIARGTKDNEINIIILYDLYGLNIYIIITATIMNKNNKISAALV